MNNCKDLFNRKINKSYSINKKKLPRIIQFFIDFTIIIPTFNLP